MAKTKEPKFTLTEICETWDKVYGENLKEEYSGFYRRLKNKKNAKTRTNTKKD